MGRHSGKCDFEDTVEIHGVDDILASKVYLGWNILPLKMESEKDLVPYYPYLVVFSASENGVGTIRLTSESYVDREERERLGWYREDAIKYVNRCKRKKKKIDLDYYNKKEHEFHKEAKTEILKRVTDGRLDIMGIYLPMHERYREDLCEEMIRVGWTEQEAKLWCFGFRALKEPEE